MDRHQRKFAKRTLILALPLAIIFSGSKFAYALISIQSNVYIYSSRTGGPIFFEDTATTGAVTWSGGTVRFNSLNYKGSAWSSIGFACDTSAGNMTIILIQPALIRYEVNAPSGSLVRTKVYVGGKGSPASVSNARDWNYTGGSQTVTVVTSHSSPVTVEMLWTGSGGGGGGGGDGPAPPGPVIPGPSPIVPTPSWLGKYGSFILVGLILAVVFYSYARTSEPTFHEQRRKAMQALLPDVEEMKKSVKKFTKKMKRSVWEE